MKILAELTLDYLWLLVFGSDEQIDPDYAMKVQESLSEYFSAMSENERAALSRAGAEAKARLLAEPDEHGYTPRKLVTGQEKDFLDALVSGEIFDTWS